MMGGGGGGLGVFLDICTVNPLYQEVAVNEKLCKTTALEFQATYVLDIC